MGYQETSREAYEYVKPKIPSIRDEIIKCIIVNGPMTCEMIEDLLEKSHQTISACITHLHKDGSIMDSGEKGKTKSGRRAIKWGIGNASQCAARVIDTPEQLKLAFGDLPYTA